MTGVVFDDGVTGRLGEDHVPDVHHVVRRRRAVWEWVENWLQTEHPSGGCT